MRKRVIAVLIFLLLALFGLYWLIPQKIHVSQARFLPVPSDAVVRCFNDFKKTKEWWPAGSKGDSNMITYNGYTFTLANIGEIFLQKIIIRTSDNDTIKTLLSSNQYPHDSSFLYWECTLSSGYSPLNRIQQYQEAKKIKSAMDTILNAFSKYASNVKNIYGISIVRTKVTDTALISMKKNFSSYPAMPQLYEMINSLKKYVKEQNAEQTNSPISSTIINDSNNYTILTAIPINKIIPENDDKKIKRLLVGGNLVMAEIKGGLFTINNALESLENYRKDYKLTPPFIPYQSLVTDRMQTTDTSQWITRVVQPVY